MKLSHLLCAMLACVPLAFEARASAGDRGSTSRDAAVAASPRRGAGNADRVHSLLNAQARGRPARQPGRPVGSARAVAHGPDDARGRQGVSAAGQPKLAASNSAAAMPAGQTKLAASNSAPPPAARLSSIPRNSAIGGPHASRLGRVGGPAISRTTHIATIDGAQLHHK